MLLLIGSAILFTNQAHFLSPHENQPQPHRSKARGIVTNTATVPVIDHELFLQAKVRVQQKRAKLAKSFTVRNFCRLQQPRALTFFIATRGFIHQTNIEGNPRVTSFNDFMEPEVYVEDDSAKVVSSTSRL